MINLDFQTIIIMIVAFTLGGLVKGATGAGSPVIAIPVLAVFFDAKLAVAIMAVPNLFSNLVQIKQFRRSVENLTFSFKLSAFGALGCLGGTLFFILTSTRIIELLVAIITVLYVVLSFKKNSKKLSQQIAKKLAPPIGLLGGFVQGTCGVSAPIALAFLNATGMKRVEFIFTISCFFGAMAAIQIVSLSFFNFMTWQLFLLGLLSLAPILLGMSLGDRLTKKISSQSFEKLILVFLILLSLQIFLKPYLI